MDDAQKISNSTLDDLGSDIASEGLSHITSHTSTCNQSTRATTPDNELFFGFRTILIATHETTSISALETAFDKYEPFERWTCAFCGQMDGDCIARAWKANEGPIPRTKRDFLTYLRAEAKAAADVQNASASYLQAIEEHVPFGLGFNRNQKMKCAIMDTQLNLIIDRIRDLITSAALIKDDHHVPDGFRVACDYLRPVLANCVGNARENHVFYKLNHTLTVGK